MHKQDSWLRESALFSDTHRILIFFPVIHTAQDMGSLSDTLQQQRQQADVTSEAKHVQKIQDFWDQVQAATSLIIKEYKSIRLYQDGLPVCEHEKNIIADLAASGSINYRIVQHMVEQGALLTGTESPPLLFDEYQLQKQLLQPPVETEGRISMLRKAADLLHKRDQFIAQRINTTLQKGETGVLFLGAMHEVEHLLEGDIKVIYPVGRLSVTAKETAHDGTFDTNR